MSSAVLAGSRPGQAAWGPCACAAVSSASVAWAYAPPARISAATQIASISSGFGGALAHRGLGVSPDAVRALGYMGDRNGDQLLGLLVQRAVGEYLPAECLKRIMGGRRELLAAVRELRRHDGIDGVLHGDRFLPWFGERVGCSLSSPGGPVHGRLPPSPWVWHPIATVMRPGGRPRKRRTRPGRASRAADGSRQPGVGVPARNQPAHAVVVQRRVDSEEAPELVVRADVVSGEDLQAAKAAEHHVLRGPAADAA